MVLEWKDSQLAKSNCFVGRQQRASCVSLPPLIKMSPVKKEPSRHCYTVPLPSFVIAMSVIPIIHQVTEVNMQSRCFSLFIPASSFVSKFSGRHRTLMCQTKVNPPSWPSSDTLLFILLVCHLLLVSDSNLMWTWLKACVIIVTWTHIPQRLHCCFKHVSTRQGDLSHILRTWDLLD